MKPIEMLGLAALATLMAMLFNAPSAMAEGSTALCKVDSVSEPGEQCPASQIITHIHEESLGHALLLSSFATVQCEVLFLGDALSSGLGNPLIIHGAFSYTCLNGCTIIEENGPAEIKVLKLGHELADVTGEWLLHYVCGLNCRYNGVGSQAHALGPLLSEKLTGSVTIEAQTVNKESGTFCPSTSKLDIETLPLIHTYIAK